MPRTMTPFALLGLAGESPKANLVIDYDVQRSILEPIGSASIAIAAGADMEIAEGYPVELWLGDLSTGMRWLAFRGYVAESDARPDQVLICGDAAHWLKETKIEAPMVADRQPMSYWVEWAAQELPAMLTLDIDLPGVMPVTRTNPARFVSRGRKKKREVSLAEFLRQVGERYRVADYLGERISYYVNLDNVLVWKPWQQPAADAHIVEHGRNLVRFDLGKETNNNGDGLPHRWEILPAPWLQPGDTFN